MHEHRKELTAPGADAAASGASAASRRADIYAAAWDNVEATMRDKQVVGYRDEQRVALLQRSEARRVTRIEEGRFGDHPTSNPASRRTGASEARIWLPDVRSGKLERVSKARDQQWAASGATYKHSQEVLVKQSIRLWKTAGYSRIRFLRWLLKAEGMSFQMDAKEWDVVKCMGAGAEKGCEVARVESFDDAQAACAELRKLPAASGANFDLDDLICWLCLSQHKEAQAGTKLPSPAEPVTVDADLCLTAQGARTRLRRKAAVLPELVRWLPVTAAGSMCQTCQQLLPVLDATRSRIADTVANIVSLQGPLAAALL